MPPPRSSQKGTASSTRGKSGNSGVNTADRQAASNSNAVNNQMNDVNDEKNLQYTPPKDPLDFETFPIEVLRKYRQQHRLQIGSCTSWNGYLLRGSVGKKTHSFKNSTRVSKAELANACKKHFLSQNVRESDCIVDFIYAVRHQDDAFKLQFGSSS